MLLLNDVFLWDDLIADLEKIQDEKTRVGSKKYSPIDEFAEYIKDLYKELATRMTDAFDEEVEIPTETDTDKIVALYLEHMTPKDDEYVEYNENDTRTIPPIWSIDPIGYLRYLETCPTEIVSSLALVPKKERVKVHVGGQPPWGSVDKILEKMSNVLSTLPGPNTIVPSFYKEKRPRREHKWDNAKHTEVDENEGENEEVRLGCYQYTADDFREQYMSGKIKEEYIENTLKPVGFGILCSTVVCVDFDTPEDYELVRRKTIDLYGIGKRSVLDGGVMEITPGGVHVYFYIDNNDDMSMIREGRISPTIDFKGLTRSGAQTGHPRPFETYTRGFVACSPTPGYRMIGDFEHIKPITPALRRWLDDAMPQDNVRDGRNAKTVRTSPEDSDFIHNIENEQNAKHLETKETDNGVSHHFRRISEGMCPGNHSHISNSFYINVANDGTVFYHCLSTECGKSYLYGVRNCMFVEDPGDEPDFQTNFDEKKFDELIQRLKTNGKDEHNDAAMDKIFAEFGKYRVLVKKPLSVVEVRYKRPGVLDFPTIVSFTDFQLLTNKDFDVFPNKKHPSFVDAWIKNKRKHIRAEKTTFNPSLPSGIIKRGGETIYNLWCGIKATRDYDVFNIDLDNNINCGYLHEMLELLETLSGDPELFDYNNRWCADLVNGRKIGTCLAFVNAPAGCGKGTFWINFMIQWVLGREICYVTQASNDLVGHFNGAIENVLLFVTDEAVFTLEKFEGVKHVVSELQSSVNSKGVNQRQIDNFVNLVMLSNNPCPGMDDRRVAASKPQITFVGNEKYWDRMAARMSAAEFTPEYTEMQKTAAALVLWWRRYREKHTKGINKVPTKNHQKSVHRSTPIVRYINESLDEIRKLLANGARSVKQQDVIDTVQKTHTERGGGTFEHPSCHDHLLRLGFEEGTVKIAGRKHDSYTIPSDEVFQEKLLLLMK
jgi:hypothetical protein